MAYNDSNYRDTERGFRLWNRPELVSAKGDGKWVPNPGDLVFDIAQGFFTVDDPVDYTTGYSTLTRWNPPVDNEGDADDNLVGIGPGYSSESYRIFLDTSVTPHTFAPDSRLKWYSSLTDHYMVFLGADISEQYGKVISNFIDSAGNFLGTKVPVEILPDGSRVPALGFTAEELPNGELVTLVAYNDASGPLSQAQLLVVNSKAIRQADSAKRYIHSIALESPFISASDRQVIEFPLNVTVESLPLTAVVNFSDGTQYRGSIDNSRFFLNGLKDYIATEVGQEFPLSLAYNLADDEISYRLSPTANRRLTVDYIARTISADGAYEAKLFAYPVWVNAQTGYRMEFWLYNMDRQLWYNVTPYMELGTNSAPFDPKAYGTLQTVTWALDLNKVDGRFAPYRHVQIFRIALLTGGDGSTVNWEMYQTPAQSSAFGRDLYADLEYRETNIWTLRLALGMTTSVQWLNKLYYAVNPLFDEDIEARAPEPTHFQVQFLHNSYEFNISQWNAALTVNNDLAQGELMYIRFIRRTYDTDLQLAIVGLPVRQRK